MPCIPSGSLLTFDVGRVVDSFTWGQGEKIPWRRRLLILNVLNTFDARLSHRAWLVATVGDMLSLEHSLGEDFHLYQHQVVMTHRAKLTILQTFAQG